MLPSSEDRRRILFVDDDQVFLETISQLFSNWSRGHWHVHVAHTSAKALSLLQEHRVVLAVVDLQMPIVDGQQFLHLLNRKYPSLQKVVLTGHATEDYRAACLTGGAELFLEKPRTSEGFETVFATLNELASWQPQEGFRGLLRQVGLQDVLQMECLGRNSSLLEVSTAKARGRIYIRNGSIVHAEAVDMTGTDALNFLLALRGGEFNLKPFAEPSTQTIEGQWEFLLMEAARMRDEALHAEATEGETMFLRAGHSLHEAERHVAARQDFGAQHPRSQTRNEGPQSGEARRIDEILVCSAQGDVLYEWECAGIEGRLSLFKIISERATPLGQILALDHFSGLEILTATHRIVTDLRADRKMFVRSSCAAPSGKSY